MFEIKLSFHCGLITLALLFLTISAEENLKNEPPFPHLDHKIHIVAESIGGDLVYETIEEYVDIDLFKNVIISNNDNGRGVTYVDSQANLIYQYKPYTCIAKEPGDLETSIYKGMLNAKVDHFEDGTRAKGGEVSVYGIAAIWLNAEEMPKTYNQAELAYSSTRDSYREAHKWTVEDEETNSLFHLYFTDAKSSESNKSQKNHIDHSLEMIQVESLKTKKITRTINIASIDHRIAPEVYDNLLQVPLGYGCPDPKLKIPLKSLYDLDLGPMFNDSHRIKLEATATRFQFDSDDGTSRKSSSDTVSLELTRSMGKDVYLVGHSTGLMQLIRLTTSQEDTKIVINYQYNVQYKIDLRSGVCVMNQKAKVDSDDRVNIRFGNGMKFTANEDTVHVIFRNRLDFRLIKSVKDPRSASKYHLYYEKEMQIGGKFWRVIRVFSMQTQMNNYDPILKLERVTILVLDETHTKITESYNMNIIEIVGLDDGVELARVFDVSEECYLNNDSMIQGRDFAWFRLNYPLSSHQAGLLSGKSLRLKNEIYARFQSIGELSFFRAPRMEIMFHETGFTLRVLLLDIPSLQLIFDEFDGVMRDNFDSNTMEDLAVDLSHCADLCRLNQCKTMSYCANTHACKISTREFQFDRSVANKLSLFVEDPACKSYTLPARIDYKLLTKLSLYSTISIFQHQNYQPVALSNQPDELVYSRAETNVDEETYTSIRSEYLSSLYKYLENEQHKMPMLTLTVAVDGMPIVLLPDSFLLEEDPLKEFGLNGREAIDSLESQESRIPPFHRGLSMHRYRIGSQNIAKRESNVEARLFTGLAYDQCSLACVDNKCSSFSYCQYRQECVITDIYDVSKRMDDVVDDSECFIAQRDFLHKFHRFQSVHRPICYKRNEQALNPSECAHSCMIESNFTCLGFTFCRASDDGADQLGACYLQEDRTVYNPLVPSVGKAYTNNTQNLSKRQTQQQQNRQSTGCDHYSRSHLADFVRIEYRQIDPNVLLNLKTSLEEGRSVDQCADICLNKLADCSAFQFCFDPENKGGPMQTCTMIESKPQDGGNNDYQVVLDKTTEARMVNGTRLFSNSNTCHVFSLRKDTSAANLRQLAFNSVTKEEFELINSRGRVGGLSYGGASLLFIVLTLLSAGICCATMMANNYNEYLMVKIERLRILAGV